MGSKLIASFCGLLVVLLPVASLASIGAPSHVAYAPQRLFGAHSSSGVLRVKLKDGASSSQLDSYAHKLGATVQNVFSADQKALSTQRAQAEARSHRQLSDLGQYKRLLLPKGESVQSVIAAVDGLSDVQFSYSEALPAPAPSLNYTSSQLYRSPAPVGIGANFLPEVPGAQGGNVKIMDVEYSWDLTHEDVTKAAVPGAYIPSSANPYDPFGYPNHGTAVLGELVADVNSFGVTGITPSASIGMVTTYDSYTGTNIANAVEVAHQHMSAGDVMLIEQQVNGPDNGNYVPVEWDPATYDAIVSAVSDGIVVVEAGANGGENLDDPMYGTTFPMGKPDSGAIIVGAAGTGGQCYEPYTAARSRLGFSDYGSRVNLQGWGECVVTAEGNQDLTPSAPLNQSYTNDFGGTSSAAPIVASAAAALSSTSKQLYGAPVSPAQIRSILEATGTPQVFTASTQGQNIGPMPNVQAALEALTQPNLFSDDFSAGNFAKWSGGQGMLLESSKTFSAGFAAEAKSTGKSAYKLATLPQQTSLYLRSKVYLASQGTTPAILLSALNTKGTRVAYLYRTQAGYLAIHNAATGKNTVSTTKLPLGGWHDLQLHIITGSTPLVEVFLDGVRVSSLSLTQSTGSLPLAQLQIGDQSTGHSFVTYFDDVGASTYYIAP